MKFVYAPIYKKAIYAGEEIAVPDWVQFIATQSNGGVWGYGQRPTFIPNQLFDPKAEGGQWVAEGYKTILGYARLGDTAPEDSLLELSGEVFDVSKS